MKAWKLTDIGKMEYGEYEKPVPGEKEVLVKVAAAGICGSDVPRTYKNGAHKMPLVIGHEFSGTVEAVGQNVSECRIGKRVGIFPLIPCRKCEACLEKKYEMCKNYNYLGSRTDGGFADYCVVPEWNLIELPQNVTFEQAAMMEPMAVAVHAMRQLKPENGMSVAVCGMGTIGQLIVMFLLEAGIRNVFAIGNKDVQRDRLVEIGLPVNNFISSREEKDLVEAVKRRNNGSLPDAYYECVGKNETIAEGLEIVKAGGRICFVGNPYGDVTFTQNEYWTILRHQLSVHGTWNSSYLGADDAEAENDDWNYVLRRLEAGSVHPEKLITHTLPLSELEKGLRIMRDKSEDYIKIMTLTE